VYCEVYIINKCVNFSSVNSFKHSIGSVDFTAFLSVLNYSFIYTKTVLSYLNM